MAGRVEVRGRVCVICLRDCHVAYEDRMLPGMCLWMDVSGVLLRDKFPANGGGLRLLICSGLPVVLKGIP